VFGGLDGLDRELRQTGGGIVRLRPALVLIVALLLMGGLAGNAAQSDEGTLRALLAEVRLLRQAIEHQGAAAAQGQLLVARLGQCNQRLARARSEAERLEAALAHQSQELSNTRITLEDLQNKPPADSDSPDDRERELTRLRKRMARQASAESELQTRRARALERADLDAGACDALESQLEQLQRQLEHRPR
jgi:chromosome segregation ATPase